MKRQPEAVVTECSRGKFLLGTRKSIFHHEDDEAGAREVMEALEQF